MTSTDESERPRDRRSSYPAPLCAGLDPSTSWDVASSLRGELYSVDRLVEHAAELARSQGAISAQKTRGPLYKRLGEVRARIRDAYAVLGRDIREGREPSPAEEWLVDNAHVVWEQLREIEEDLPAGYLIELPRIASGAMRGFPRVYAPCIDYLRHTDGRVDLETLSSYVRSYQSVSPLTIGELWAIPIMLRMGLLLIVGALAASEARSRDGARGRASAERVLAAGDDVVAIKERLAALDRDEQPITATFLVALVRKLREPDGLVGPAERWVGAQCARRGTTPEELIRREHLRKAADQLSVGNAVTSMRAIGALDWQAFFDGTSGVEAILCGDPSGDYRRSDDATRDRYRHAVERLARRGAETEEGVANAAIELARARMVEGGDLARTHVGFYLVDEGQPELEARIGYRPRVIERIRRTIERHASATYIGGICAVTAVLVASFASGAGALGLGTSALVLLSILLVVPASELAVAFVNGLVVAIMRPRLLQKLDFEHGIPEQFRTLVVVPAMITAPDVIRTLIDDLEVRALANLDPRLCYALLTDFGDADTPVCEGDEALLALARDGIAELDARHGGLHRFVLLHRHRVWCETERRFMGWERKRGKLEELNRLLRGATDTTYSTLSVAQDALSSVRYVIALDADTELPRDVARRLVGAMAHPLNRARVDIASRRVVRGYGIIQPRVGTSPLSARRTRFARVVSGPSGIDPYTTAISDVYQDLFGEGSFIGKGIYDVDAFIATAGTRVPPEHLLSHDLFEGVYARAALVSDIEVLDEQPSSYAVHAARQHRWIRGDFQLLPWLGRTIPSADGGTESSDLRALDRFKIFDNLRRAMLAPTLVALMVAGWLLGRDAAIAATSIVASVLLVPLLARTLFSLLRVSSKPSRSMLGTLGGDLGAGMIELSLGFSLLLDQALLCADAIARTCDRLFRTRRRLLEWTTMAESTRRTGRRRGLATRTLVGGGIAVGLGVLVAALVSDATMLAVPVLFVWTLGPAIAASLGRPRLPVLLRETMTAAERRFLRRVAFKTWRFFERFVTEQERHLPPDNFQEDPRGVVAGRTSPTNIGLYLLSVVAARDLGFIGARGMLARLGRTLTTIERMETFEGHLLNWYETATLRPLDPRYVSTVDSGNFAAYLWTLRAACEEVGERAILSSTTTVAVLDAIHLALEGVTKTDEASAARAIGKLSLRSSTEYEQGPSSIAATVATLRAIDLELDALLGSSHASELAPMTREILGEARAMITAALEDTRALVPFLSRLDVAPKGLTHASLAPSFAGLRAYLSSLASPRGVVLGTERALEQIRALGRSAVEALALEGQAEVLGFLGALEAEVVQAEDACTSLLTSLHTMGTRANALAEAMQFGFLFDTKRELFSIGYNVGAGRLDGSHYDLLASEARLASIFAIAKGDVPQTHWWRLARTRTTAASRDVLISWSGSMFEYLMPFLVTENPPGTLLYETSRTAVRRQVQYGRQRNVPWGVSESAYNLLDFGMTYQYRAFGVPGLGLKSGLGEDLVIAPYATGLAALVEPRLAVANLASLSREGAEGPYGYYEAIDYTPARTPPGRPHVIVKAYMAHHQGMMLVALEEVLCDGLMRRRFHRDPRIKATELLLEERVPVRSHIVKPKPSQLASRVSEPDLDAVEYVGLGSNVRAHLLGHGELSTLITSMGDGFTMWRGIDVNRFREDPSLGSGGTYIYVRERSAGRVWSSGFQPTRAEPDFYEAAFANDKVELRRRDGDVETNTEIVASPEHAVEIRRVTLRNRGLRPVTLDVTTYTEVVLAPRAADVAHRAFSNMFVATEALPERGALLAMRRPRSKEEPERWVVQILMPGRGEWSPLDFECSRSTFLGRDGSMARPVGITSDAELGRGVGMVLDPALCLRRGVRLAPGARARVSLITAMASSRDEALALVDVYAAPHSVRRAFELAWADARVELKHLGISALDVHRYQRLLTHVLFPVPELRAEVDPSLLRGRGRGALWAQGISGDLPIVVLRVDEPELAELGRELVLAHEFFRLNGVAVDLVLLTDEPSGYLKPLEDAVRDVVSTTRGVTRPEQRGGVFVRRADQMGDDVAVLMHAARVVLRTSSGSLAKQLRKVGDRARARPVPTRLAAAPLEARANEPDVLPLAFDCGVSGFDEGEYVMRVGPGQRTPAPFSNVLSNPEFGTLVTESGVGATWRGNSQLHRLTPWSNDAVLDPPSQAIYVRDGATGQPFSMTPRPAGHEAAYHVRHGQGYTEYTHTRADLVCTLRVFVGPDDPVQLSRVRIVNRGRVAGELSLLGVTPWVLGSSRETTRTSIVTRFDQATSAIVASNPLGLEPERCAFYAATRAVESYSGDRFDVYGVAGSSESPASLHRPTLANRVGAGLDPCAALRLFARVEPGATYEVTFLLGEGDGIEHVRGLVRAHADAAHIDVASERTIANWKTLLSAVTVRTPDPALDLMVNHWLLYQTVGCRLWGRSGFYQSGGAFGFRDQIQDVLAVLHTRPEIARAHLVRAAARQFVEGDVQHWWHANTGQGVRTHCSDDMLWLPYAVAEYVRVTADAAILDESIAFLEERTLVVGEPDLFSAPRSSAERASLYEHCTRALAIGTTDGPNGMAKMRGGDWNDGMNRVGEKDIGESVWLSWFLAKTLGDFALVARLRGDEERAAWCDMHRGRLRRAIEAHAWDGDWYHRAYYDDGTPIGSRLADECRIDAIAQSWAVLSGEGDPVRARHAVDQSEAMLVRESDGLMLLLTPPFAHGARDPGYIKAYPEGIRENGGQYTHAALWTVQALARLGEGDRAMRLLSLINPIHHARDAAGMQRYRVEPYVLAADVYGAHEHVGRGGWTWYTGSASWMYRIIIEDLLGLARRGDVITITPCVPRAWPRFEIDYRVEGGTLHILVENPEGVSAGVASLHVDGVESSTGEIPLHGTRRVIVTLGIAKQAKRSGTHDV